MPKFYEVYGNDVYDRTANVIAERKVAYCPFTESTCDGGGNRHQTKIKLEKSELRDFFDEELNAVIPGVCSIEYGGETWIVCPRRLLGFTANKNEIPVTNHSLKDHEREALIEAGLPTGVELGVWPEVYLRYGDDDATINYHFDYVIAPIFRDTSFSDLMQQYDIIDEEEIKQYKKAAQSGKYLKVKYAPDKLLPVLPDVDKPVMIEVMTASTSGSDKEAGTDIASSFADAIQGREHNCPSINKRQVWGRMVTQLFAKSALAESWGGKTIWLVQDQLIKSVELTTKLKLSDTQKSSSGTVNFLSMAYKENKRGIDSVEFKDYSERKAGLDFAGNKMCTDILLPKINPEKKELLKSVLRRKLAAILIL